MWRDKKGAIFDMDGTLMDSMWMWKDIDIEYLGRFGIEMPENLQREIEGMSIKETAVYFRETFGITDSIEKMISDWNDMAIGFYRTRVTLKTGALELLKQMKERGMKTGIATSNSVELTRECLAANSVEDLFDTIRAGHLSVCRRRVGDRSGRPDRIRGYSQRSARGEEGGHGGSRGRG